MVTIGAVAVCSIAAGFAKQVACKAGIKTRAKRCLRLYDTSITLSSGIGTTQANVALQHFSNRKGSSASVRPKLPPKSARSAGVACLTHCVDTVGVFGSFPTKTRNHPSGLPYRTLAIQPSGDSKGQ